MVGYSRNQTGRLKCDYCKHKTYKYINGVIAHLNSKHMDQWLLDQANAEIERLKNIPPKIEIREKVVYKEKPEPKYWYVRERGIEGIYCTSCKQVQRGVGIPYGQTIENTPHHCGNRTLLPVVEVK